MNAELTAERRKQKALMDSTPSAPARVLIVDDLEEIGRAHV